MTIVCIATVVVCGTLTASGKDTKRAARTRPIVTKSASTSSAEAAQPQSQTTARQSADSPHKVDTKSATGTSARTAQPQNQTTALRSTGTYRRCVSVVTPYGRRRICTFHYY